MTIISPLVQMEQQLRIWHWETLSYAQHKAFGDTYDALGDLIDQFVEIFIGKYGRPTAKIIVNLELDNVENTDILGNIDNFAEYLVTDLNLTLDSVKDSDLLNVRDEMVGTLNRLKYLLTLK